MESSIGPNDLWTRNASENTAAKTPNKDLSRARARHPMIRMPPVSASSIFEPADAAKNATRPQAKTHNAAPTTRLAPCERLPGAGRCGPPFGADPLVSESRSRRPLEGPGLTARGVSARAPAGTGGVSKRSRTNGQRSQVPAPRATAAPSPYRPFFPMATTRVASVAPATTARATPRMVRPRPRGRAPVGVGCNLATAAARGRSEQIADRPQTGSRRRRAERDVEGLGTERGEERRGDRGNDEHEHRRSPPIGRCGPERARAARRPPRPRGPAWWSCGRTCQDRHRYG